MGATVTPGKEPSWRGGGGTGEGKLRLREGEKTCLGSRRAISDKTRRGEPALPVHLLWDPKRKTPLPQSISSHR